MSFVSTDGGGYVSTLLQETGLVEHLFGTARRNPEGPFLRLKQVHSARIVDAADWREGLEADGLATATPGLRLAVRTADCVPLLLFDPVARAIAAVHAGWRGAALGIALEAVRFLATRHGARAGNMIAALGPAIGGCCYEVGSEVAHQFRALFPERNDLGTRTKIDLREALRRQLILAGLSAAAIDVSPHCTRCGGGEFHSWRRDGPRAGRMVSLIGLRTGA
ncbi:MAG: peptidoglycan editing factor PgeF [Bryobacteraceae bacterium]|nr:peptidoglycan editing factor PgeF [Bryobacteraceae bacterium]